MIDPVLRLLRKRIISKNVVEVTLAGCLQISLEFFPVSLFFIYMQAKPFKTERNIAIPKSIAVKKIPTLAVTFTTDASESTGQQMGTDAPAE